MFVSLSVYLYVCLYVNLWAAFQCIRIYSKDFLKFFINYCVYLQKSDEP